MDWNVCGESYTPEGTTYVNFFVLGYDLCIIKHHVKCNGPNPTPAVNFYAEHQGGKYTLTPPALPTPPGPN